MAWSSIKAVEENEVVEIKITVEIFRDIALKNRLTCLMQQHYG